VEFYIYCSICHGAGHGHITVQLQLKLSSW